MRDWVSTLVGFLKLPSALLGGNFRLWLYGGVAVLFGLCVGYAYIEGGRAERAAQNARIAALNLKIASLNEELTRLDVEEDARVAVALGRAREVFVADPSGNKCRKLDGESVKKIKAILGGAG